VTTIPQNRPRLYIKILQCAKRLARHDEAPADVLDAILSGVVRGDFNGHMKHKRSSHPSECLEFYDDCDDWSSEDFMGAFSIMAVPTLASPSSIHHTLQEKEWCAKLLVCRMVSMRSFFVNRTSTRSALKSVSWSNGGSSKTFTRALKKEGRCRRSSERGAERGTQE
jgi:hypothetical protein